jgi:hypothetical protein
VGGLLQLEPGHAAAAARRLPQDKAINQNVQRFMATRANARITEVDASHAVMLSRPDAVTKLIEQAAR